MLFVFNETLIITIKQCFRWSFANFYVALNPSFLSNVVMLNSRLKLKRLLPLASKKPRLREKPWSRDANNTKRNTLKYVYVLIVRDE